MKDKRYYVGMDVHKATTVIVVLDANGKQVMKMVVETASNRILEAIAGIKGEIHITFEEGIHSSWLYDLLKEKVNKLIVCNPMRMNLSS